MPAAVENPEADGHGMENPMQTDSQLVHLDPVVAGTDQQCDAGYLAVPNSVLPILNSTEVTCSESGPDEAEADPIQNQSCGNKTMKRSSQTEEEVSRQTWHQTRQPLATPSRKLMKNMLPFLHQICALQFEEPSPITCQLTSQPALPLES